MKKNKLKAIAILLVAICWISTTVCAFAAEGHECVDELRNVSFTVPNSWTQDDTSQQDTIMYAFSLEKDDTLSQFNYYPLDIYSETISQGSDASNIDREELNNSVFTIEQFEDGIRDTYNGMGFTLDSIEAQKSEINGNDYFRANCAVNMGTADIANLVQFLHIYKGYGYYFTFTFSKETDEEIISEIMSTVTFGDELRSNKIKTNAEKSMETGEKILSNGLLKALGYVVISGIVGCLVAVFCKKKKRNTPENTRQYNNQPYNNNQQYNNRQHTDYRNNQPRQ